ncbi:hypothetical protein F3Y22_tig00111013pilonHSYRG00253 [Hibiscus syriacus]|uniref:Uncharacterized protein n=1 Tax=Hibiscus syriacus TaxID=106335 RepID=A0A6A2Z6X3_HIBSY|nr:hypothetical protein F3Y22_tig00111013pilonHSYRG00253 [Hibiscus syriacus]
MGRAPCCDKANVKRRPWIPEEDAALKTYVQTHGTGGNWIALPLKAASQLPGRTDNDVKNCWNTKLKKKLLAGKSTSFNIDNNGGFSFTNAADVGYGFSVSSTSQSLPLDPVMQFNSHPSCSNLDNSHNSNVIVVSSLEGSAGNGYVEDSGSVLVDAHHHEQQQQFSYEFPYEFINGGEIGVPSLADFSC